MSDNGMKWYTIHVLPFLDQQIRIKKCVSECFCQYNADSAFANARHTN